MYSSARNVTADTVFSWIDIARQQLVASGACFGHGTDNAADEAAWLVAGGLGMAVDGDIEDAAVDAAASARLETLLHQRCQQKIPTAYLLKEAWFANMPFTVDSSVLIPRSPVAELIGQSFLPWLQQQPRHILDVGTGSGCIAIALARAFPEALVDAVDNGSMELAARNVARHEIDDRVKLVHSDIYSSLGNRRYDLIVANPPYVPTAQIATLPAEYGHEPRAALDGGEDGLDTGAPHSVRSRGTSKSWWLPCSGNRS